MPGESFFFFFSTFIYLFFFFFFLRQAGVLLILISEQLIRYMYVLCRIYKSGIVVCATSLGKMALLRVCVRAHALFPVVVHTYIHILHIRYPFPVLLLLLFSSRVVHPCVTVHVHTRQKPCTKKV